MRRYQSFPSPGPENSLHYMYRYVPWWKVVRNFVVIFLCRYLPLSLKNSLYRLLGVKVGRGVSVGLMAMLDIFYPQMITIGDHSIIGYNSTVLCHEFLVDCYHLGPVEIGARVMIGANVTVLPGVRIGDGAVVAACSLVNRDVPPGAMVGGIPARMIREGGDR